MSITNLKSLPEDLDFKWPQHAALVFEDEHLTAFPLVLKRLRPCGVSLCGNLITSLPPEAFLMQATNTIAFTGNPLTNLPAAGVDPRLVTTKTFYLDMTGIASLPQWMYERFFQDKTLALGGTPICVGVLLNSSATAERKELLAKRPSEAKAIDCFELSAHDQPYYPYHLEVRSDESV